MEERRVEERERTERQPEPEPTRTHPDEFNTAAKKPIDLKVEFEQASGSAGDGGEAAGGSVQEPAPEPEITIQRRRRTRDRSQDDPERSTKSPYSGSTERGPTYDPKPNCRRRDRDFGQDR